MSYKIEYIEGIGEAYGAKLRANGITTTTALLKAGGDRKGRSKLASDTGLDDGRILKWVNMADLMRIKGIGKQYAELLEASGVDTVKELRNRNGANLTQKMAETNEQKKLARAVPPQKTVEGWIKSAKELQPAVTY